MMHSGLRRALWVCALALMAQGARTETLSDAAGQAAGAAGEAGATTPTVVAAFGQRWEVIQGFVETAGVLDAPVEKDTVRVFCGGYWGGMVSRDYPSTTPLTVLGCDDTMTLGEFLDLAADLEANFTDPVSDGGFLGLVGRVEDWRQVVVFSNPGAQRGVEDDALRRVLRAARDLEVFLRHADPPGGEKKEESHAESPPSPRLRRTSAEDAEEESSE